MTRHRSVTAARLHPLGCAAVLALLTLASGAAGAALAARTADPVRAPVTRSPTWSARGVSASASSRPAVAPRVVPAQARRSERARSKHPPPPVPVPTTAPKTTTTSPPATAPPVAASIETPTDSPPTPFALCVEAVAQVAWPAGWSVSCEGSRSGLLGLTNRDGTHLYTRSGLSESFEVMVAAHEAGHAWDFTRLDDAKIAAWCTARGCNAAAFYEGSVGGPGWVEAGGAEDWAEVWRICHDGSDMRNYIGLGPPSPQLCALQQQLIAG